MSYVSSCKVLKKVMKNLENKQPIENHGKMGDVTVSDKCPLKDIACKVSDLKQCFLSKMTNLDKNIHKGSINLGQTARHLGFKFKTYCLNVGNSVPSCP